MSDYQPPVAKLLKYGDFRKQRNRLNYVEKIQLEAQPITEDLTSLLKKKTQSNQNKGFGESQQKKSRKSQNPKRKK